VLRAALRDVVLRRRKDDVLRELPPLVLQDIPLELSPEMRARFSSETRQLETALQGRSDAEVLRRLHSVAEPLARVRRELGELKTAAAILWLRERLASTDKILVFAWHREVIARLCRGLAEFHPVVVTGDTPGRLRAAVIDGFQNRPEVRVFIGQILAAGTAITLTAANEVAIVEPSWVPGENHQAICRAHRLGQRDSVLATFLYLRGTLDQRILQVFRRKAAEISELSGDDNANHDRFRHGSADGGADLRRAHRGAAGAADPV
jgi:SWI/SNF-related matrix-associated actin-dependent regulator 1 of chromatin subfamily A